MGDIADYYTFQQAGDDCDNQNHKKLKPLLHKCKDGKIVDVRGISKEYPKMEDQHLLNTINYIKRKAKEGFLVINGGGSTPDDFWYDEKLVIGKKAKKLMYYKKYKKEAKKRRIWPE